MGTTERGDLALRAGTLLGAFEIERVLARSARTVVYLAADRSLQLPVAIQEYLPAHAVERGTSQGLQSIPAWHEDALAHGTRAFIEEARMLARCEHPALLRVLQLFESNGTVYRVMPYYRGRRLLDLCRDHGGAPDEEALRAVLEDLLGAIDAIHREGHVHGGVAAANIMLLDTGRPLLLGPGAAMGESGNKLVGSLMAGLAAPRKSPASREGAEFRSAIAADDLHALAQAMRCWITGDVGAPRAQSEQEPLAFAMARRRQSTAPLRYSPTLLSALDAAASPFVGDWPRDVAQFREWLTHGSPRGAADAVPQDVAGRFDPGMTSDSDFDAARAQSIQPPEIQDTTLGSTEGPKLFSENSSWSFSANSVPIPPARPSMSASGMAPPQRSKHRAARRPDKRNWLVGLVGTTVLVMGAGGLAFALWDLKPPIALDRIFAVALSDRATTSLPEPELRASPVDLPAAAPLPRASVISPPPGTEATMPAVAQAAAAPVELTSTVPARAPISPDSAAPTSVPPTPHPARRESHAPAEPASPKVASDPRTQCSPRTDFALFRCMDGLCRSAQWSSHPQCVRMRKDGDVE